MIKEPWDPAVDQLLIRIALHTGTAQLREGDYYGPAVNLAARLLTAGHGGQILLSHSSQELVRDHLPDDVSLVDLGKYKLRDITRPEHIYQLTAPDLPKSFPELRTIAVQPGNLPSQPTPFIGRETELRAVTSLLRRDGLRLVTLSGSGGVGKTRLALQVAKGLIPNFEDGVFFVDLAPIDDPGRVADTIASVLDVGESSEQALDEGLKQYLGQKHMLLVIDNLEHVIESAALLIDLLQAAPRVKILVTSREALNFHEEWQYPLAGMPYPETFATGETLNYSAVQLFVERASRVRPDFELANEEQSVVRICQLVEGIPLAIELAAAWTKTLSCEAIADEIEQNLDFLATRLRNLPERHRSMRAVFDYSWVHLSDAECKAFRRISVFKDGFSRSAAETITETSLITLTSLVDKSLLRWEPALNGETGEGRYRLHALLAQFGEEHLAQDPEEDNRLHQAHGEYYAAYARQLYQDSLRGRQQDAAKQTRTELENIRAAWHWAIDNTQPEFIAKIAPLLFLYYQFNSRFLQGVSETEQAIQMIEQAEPTPENEAALARMLVDQGWMNIRIGQMNDAESMLIRSKAIHQRLGIAPEDGLATDPAIPLGIIASIKGEFAEAARLGQEARRRSEQNDQPINRQFAYYLLTGATLGLGDYESAQQYAQKAYDITKENQDHWFLAYCLNELGHVAYALKDLAAAEGYYQESYAIRQEFNDPEGMALALSHLGQIALRREDCSQAEQLFQRSFDIYQEINDKGGLARACNGLANTAVGLGQYRLAERRFVDALQIAAGIHFLPLLLMILAGIGELFLRIGRVERGKQILVTVQHHPAGEHLTKQRAERALEPYELDTADVSALDLDAAVELAIMELEKSSQT